MDQFILLVNSSRIRKTINWGYIFLGYLLAENFSINLSEIWELVKVYLILGLIMYGGLYSINSYADLKRDRKDEKTVNRLLPSGAIDPRKVLVWGICLVVISLILGFLLLQGLLVFQIILIVINLMYTFYLKDSYGFIAIPVIALTGPIKVMIGVFLSGINPASFWYLYTVQYFVSISYHALKWLRRPNLNCYGVNFLQKASFVLASLFTLVFTLQARYYVLIFYIPFLINFIFYRFSPSYHKLVASDWDKD